MGSPLRLGLALGGMEDAGAWARAFARAERAEALGLHSLWLPEAHFAPGATPAPLLGLADLAARTRRLVLGTTSLLLPLRAPRALASEVAALDRLSGGRVWLGLGRGFRAPLFEAFGVPAAEKRDRFDAALDAMLAAWRDGEAPLQRPHPPLLVAAFGRKGLLQAARRGLPYLASPLESLAELEANCAFHREHLVGGAACAPVAASVIRTVHVCESEDEARRVLGALGAERERVARALPPALAGAGAGDLEERVLVGSAARVTGAIARYRERIGLDLLIVRPAAPAASEAECDASLARLVREVLPAFG